MRIFVSIASYCDPMLAFTLERAVATAAHPERLHFGVVDQSPEGTPRVAHPGGGARLTQVRIAAVDARGPCWARAIGMSLYDGEDWFLQLDSHMDFDAGWDETLIAHTQVLLPGRPGVVVSSYPNAFVLENGQVVRKPSTSKVLAHVVKTGTVFEETHPVLGFEAHPVETDQPVPGIHVGAGCLFGPGSMVQLFPYDPWFYFHGEEQGMSLRLYTAGWDIFHVPGLPVHHLYNTVEAGAPARPMHWDEGHEAQREVGWWHFEQRSRQRLGHLVAGANLGVYSLGRVRTLADYAAFSGIDYGARTIAPRSYQPIT